jgi:hypothetical protein
MAQGVWEMTFTDEDLGRLKEELAANRRMEWPMPDCEAFIARLEAAEKCATSAGAIINDHLGINSNDERLARDYAEAVAVWRKAAGK